MLTKGMLFAGGAMKTVGQLPEWLVQHFGKGTDSIGAYLESATLFRALEIRGGTIASGKLCLYQKDGTEIETHPLLDLLATVNDEWNPSDLWRYTDSGLMVYGAGYWQKVRAGRRLRALFYMNPSTVLPRFTSQGIVAFQQWSSATGYTPQGLINGKPASIFPRGDVVYFKGAYDPRSDLRGLPPLRWVLNAAFGEAAAEKYLNAFFTNGAVPAVIFSTDQPMGDPEITKAEEWWRRLFVGAANAFKTAFLGRGLRPYTVGSTIKDMELAGVRSELRRTICIATGVPELLISATDSADLTPVDLAMKLLYYTTVIPAWARYAETLNAELLTEYPDLVGESAYLAWDTDDIQVLTEDATAKTARLVSLKVAGILKPETVALELGYDESDVPEPLPVVAPGDPNAPSGQQSEDAPAEKRPTAQRAVASLDLERWQRKALSSLAKGKPAAVTFTSDAISATEHARISAALEDCQTAAAVRAVFDADAPEPTLGEVMAEVRRAREALERA